MRLCIKCYGLVRMNVHSSHWENRLFLHNFTKNSTDVLIVYRIYFKKSSGNFKNNT